MGQSQEAPETEKASNLLKRKAREAERVGEIHVAISYYETLYRKHPQKEKFQEKLAYLYFASRNYDSTVVYLKRIISNKPDDSPLAYFYLGVVQKQLGNYDEAEKNLIVFKKKIKSVKDPSFKKLYKSELAGIELGQKLMDSTKNAEVFILPDYINTPHIEFSPIPIDRNNLIFGSLREGNDNMIIKDTSRRDSLPVRKFYTATKNKNNKWIFNGEWNGPFNSNIDIGNGDFSLDSSIFYFTRCEENWQYKTICKIFVSKKLKGTWTTPIVMDELVNMPDFTSSHPTIAREPKSGEEVMYFVSDRPAGKGGKDIWYTQYNTRRGKWKKPRNVGTKINTAGDEITPNYSIKNKTLYFSSNGHPNLGGLDIYSAVGEGRKFDVPENLGFPINSTFDDLDFVLNDDGKGGFLISNRSGGQSAYSKNCCDDIYEFSYIDFKEIVCSGRLVEAETGKCVVNKVDIQVYILEKDQEPYLAQSIPSSGCDYLISLIPGKNYRINTFSDNYYDGQFEITPETNSDEDSVIYDFELKRIPQEAVALPAITFEFNSETLTSQAKKNIDSTILKLLFLDPKIQVEIRAHTDNKGNENYNLALSQRRAESVTNYLREKGISPERVIPKGFGESQPIAANSNPDGSDNPSGRAQNRRIEFKIVGKIDKSQFLEEVEDKPHKKSKKRSEPQF